MIPPLSSLLFGILFQKVSIPVSTSGVKSSKAEKISLVEDSSEDEITFRTPPGTVKVKRTKTFTDRKENKGLKGKKKKGQK